MSINAWEWTFRKRLILLNLLQIWTYLVMQNLIILFYGISNSALLFVQKFHGPAPLWKVKKNILSKIGICVPLQKEFDNFLDKQKCTY